MNAPAQAPPKLFREEAKTGAVSCPACGGPITLRGFGSVERVMCPYCGSELDPQDSGELDLLQQAQRQRRQSVLPLHSRGQLDGDLWEIIGITWRECNVDGITYPWQEFLLYNPYRGYRYLVFTMTDGHWTLGQVLDGAPQVQAGLGHKRVVFKKDKYKHFQTSMAVVSYVEGEFPWQVHVGDQAVAHDYVAPPYSVSIEEAYGPEGQDVNFTRMKHITGEEVWKAFGLQGAAPPTSGVGMCQPNPWKTGPMAHVGRVRRVAGSLAPRHRGLHRRRETSDSSCLDRQRHPGRAVHQRHRDQSRRTRPRLEVDMSARGLSNAYHVPRRHAHLAGARGGDGPGHHRRGMARNVSGGESWREGRPKRPSVVIGDVKPGKYLLQVTPQAGDQIGSFRFGDAPEVPGQTFQPQGGPVEPQLRPDDQGGRGPHPVHACCRLSSSCSSRSVYWLFGAIFEGRRWQNSDYATSIRVRSRP